MSLKGTAKHICSPSTDPDNPKTSIPRSGQPALRFCTLHPFSKLIYQVIIQMDLIKSVSEFYFMIQLH